MKKSIVLVFAVLFMFWSIPLAGAQTNGVQQVPLSFLAQLLDAITSLTQKIDSLQKIVNSITPTVVSTSTSTSTPSSTLQVVSPNGGELWRVGEQRDVQWTSSNIPSNAYVQLYLIDVNSGQGKQFIASVQNTGRSFQWLIPQNLGALRLGAGNVYLAEAISGGAIDQSDTLFSIFSASSTTSTVPAWGISQPTSTSTSTPSSTLQVVSPNGGELWRVGEQRDVQWTSSNIPSNAYVQLYLIDVNSGQGKQFIASVQNTGRSFQWLIPQNLGALRLGAGNVYLAEAVSGGAIDQSNSLFSILSASSTTSTLTTAFNRNLVVGDAGDDVLALQKFLNANGFLVAEVGIGSPGNETMIFGPATKRALQKFQKSIGVPTTGFFGSMTRGYINSR